MFYNYITNYIATFCLFDTFSFSLAYQPKFLMQKSEQQLFKQVWPYYDWFGIGEGMGCGPYSYRMC